MASLSAKTRSRRNPDDTAGSLLFCFERPKHSRICNVAEYMADSGLARCCAQGTFAKKTQPFRPSIKLSCALRRQYISSLGHDEIMMLLNWVLAPSEGVRGRRNGRRLCVDWYVATAENLLTWPGLSQIRDTDVPCIGPCEKGLDSERHDVARWGGEKGSRREQQQRVALHF